MKKHKPDPNSTGESLPNEQVSAVNTRMRLWQVYQFLLEAGKSPDRNQADEKKVANSTLNLNKS